MKRRKDIGALSCLDNSAGTSEIETGPGWIRRNGEKRDVVGITIDPSAIALKSLGFRRREAVEVNGQTYGLAGMIKPA